MGASHSSQQIVHDVVNKSVTNTLQKNVQSTDSSVASLQLNEISGANLKGCTLVQENVVDMKQTIVQDLKSQDYENMVNDITNSLQNSLTNQASAKTKGILGSPAVADATTKVKESLKTDIETNFSKETINNMISTMRNHQENFSNNVTIDMCSGANESANNFVQASIKAAADGNIALSKQLADEAVIFQQCELAPSPCLSQMNKASLTQTISQSTAAISKIINSNKALNDLQEKIKTQAAAESTGISLSMIFAIIGIVMIVVGFFALKAFLSPAGQNAAKAAVVA